MPEFSLTAASQTVIQLDEYLTQLKTEAAGIYNPAKVAEVGYITASQELAVRQLQLSC